MRDRGSANAKGDRDPCGRSFGRKRRRIANRSDNGDATADEVGHERRQAVVLAGKPVVLDRHVLALDVARFAKAFTKRGCMAYGTIERSTAEKPHHRHRRLLRVRRQGPRRPRAAESSQQSPPSDGDCHTPLPCEVRKRNDITPRACSLDVSRRAGCWLLPPLFPPRALRER